MEAWWRPGGGLLEACFKIQSGQFTGMLQACRAYCHSGGPSCMLFNMTPDMVLDEPEVLITSGELRCMPGVSTIAGSASSSSNSDEDSLEITMK